ncbi:thymidine phosphorylase [candidate division KSB1 bacterium]|nr:thymidine phosphorylase [candidate division KSB1 bacterium]
MTVQDIIVKKRDGGELSSAEIDFLVNGYSEGKIPDYQMAAFLMAVYFQGMNFSETVALTRAMIGSGKTVDLGSIHTPKVDKHSTGGVGDKVSLVVAPLVAAAGVAVPMISGRGLGHTGGTLDKLESIPGFRSDLSISEFKSAIRRIRLAIIGQTDSLVPADRKIYSLRDVTGTVKSIPLISASIMSKKIAEGIDALVLDVKVGKGAVFQESLKALKLAKNLVAIGEEFGKKTVALLTRMDEPLGYAVGNWVEVKEAVDCLKGATVSDLMEVSYALGAQMLLLGGKVKSIPEGYQRLKGCLETGEALKKFLEFVENQGGDTSYLGGTREYPTAKHSIEVGSSREGTIAGIDAGLIGRIAISLGAGRREKEDEVDPKAGIILHRKTGDWVGKDGLLATAFTDLDLDIEEIKEKILSAFNFGESVPGGKGMILGVVDRERVRDWIVT